LLVGGAFPLVEGGPIPKRSFLISRTKTLNQPILIREMIYVIMKWVVDSKG
jgi:hypothetical protein